MRKLKRKNKERKWCYLECGWIGFSALMISDVSFSVCGLQRGDRRLWRSETWERSCISPYPPPSPQKHTASMCHKWTQQVHLFFSFFWSGLLFNETIVPSSGERRKKRLPKMVKNILKIESGKTWTAFHLLKGLKATGIHLPEWLGKAHHNHRRFTKGFEKEKVAKIMFSFISWNLHEGWDEWFHYHSTHQQQETP